MQTTCFRGFYQVNIYTTRKYMGETYPLLQKKSNNKYLGVFGTIIFFSGVSKVLQNLSGCLDCRAACRLLLKIVILPVTIEIRKVDLIA
jgi:hypothetical protein